MSCRPVAVALMRALVRLGEYSVRLGHAAAMLDPSIES
jgi:hypothetical protein